MSAVAWYPSETGEGVEAEAGGYVAAVHAALDGDGIFWRVDATAAVSEWPEVYACGFAATEADARRDAEAALARAASRPGGAR